MPVPKDPGLDFINAAMGLSNAPPTPVTSGVDLPDGFPAKPPGGQLWREVDTSKDPEAIPGNVETDVVAKRGYFTTYRPWEYCPRCKDDIASQTVALPEAGDLICPHTNIASWEDVYQRAAKGQVRVVAEQELVQKDGTVVVSVAWLVYSPKKKSKIAPSTGQQEEPNL
jgi:hypothetical protein